MQENSILCWLFHFHGKAIGKPPYRHPIANSNGIVNLYGVFFCERVREHQFTCAASFRQKFNDFGFRLLAVFFMVVEIFIAKNLALWMPHFACPMMDSFSQTAVPPVH